MTTQPMSDGNTCENAPADFITALTQRDPDWVNLTLTGSRPAVTAMINLLHQVNVIGASEWSKAIALKSSSMIIRVASRGIGTGGGDGVTR